MQVRFDLLTTRGGDEGKTSLYNGERRSKADSVFELLGSVDELSSALGLARAVLKTGFLYSDILQIQKDLVIMGGQFASPPPMPASIQLNQEALQKLEEREAFYLRGLVLKSFIQPGSCIESAHLDLARSICRRAERVLVRYIQESATFTFSVCQQYLNRLSDFLFAAARWIAKTKGIHEDGEHSNV